jgi:hypothetical protein
MLALEVARAALTGVPDLAAAELSPANPYGSAKHGDYSAGSAAQVAEGVDRGLGLPAGYLPQHQGLDFCAIQHHDGFLCTGRPGHDGDHTAHGATWPQAAGVAR